MNNGSPSTTVSDQYGNSAASTVTGPARPIASPLHRPLSADCMYVHFGQDNDHRFRMPAVAGHNHLFGICRSKYFTLVTLAGAVTGRWSRGGTAVHRLVPRAAAPIGDGVVLLIRRGALCSLWCRSTGATGQCTARVECSLFRSPQSWSTPIAREYKIYRVRKQKRNFKVRKTQKPLEGSDLPKI